MISIEELERIFENHWELTGTLDPRLNGELDKLLEPLNPNDPALSSEARKTVIQARTDILDKWNWEHELMVGQRMANQVLLSNIRERIRNR